MPAVPSTPRVKLRTATRRVPRTRSAEADASPIADAEPNMSLSRAILVMLLLHVVAAGGFVAFSLVKERGHGHIGTGPASALEAEDSDAAPAKVEGHDAEHATPDPVGTLANTRAIPPAEPLTRVSNEPVNAASSSNPANDAAARIAGGRTAGTAASPAAVNPTAGDKSHLPADSGKIYVVLKGESLNTIADKLKVEASALLKLNGIDDPKKLKAGQTLHVPAAAHAKTK